MITLKKLYFEPNFILGKEIAPIFFEKGLNILLGERSVDSEKMNSVGKSLLVEMINYSLFADTSYRVSKIPNDVLSDETCICLDLEIENQTTIEKITIKRKRNAKAPIIIKIGGNENEFEKLEDAKNYFESILFSGEKNKNRPSIRNLISILIREEKSSFDDILRPYAIKRYLDFNDLIRPHLYLFDFDIEFVEQMKRVQKSISDTTTTLRNVKNTFKDMGIDVKAVRSYINDLEDKVDKLNLSIEELMPGEALRQKKDDLQKLEYDLENLITVKASKTLAINKIKRLPRFEKISPKKIEIIYNTFREGLGDLVRKSVEEVTEFHERIETFQNKIFDQRLTGLLSEVAELDRKIDCVERDIAKIYKLLNADKKIGSLKQALKVAREKDEKLSSVTDKYRLLEQKREEKKSFDRSRIELLKEIDKQIANKRQEIESFENDLKELHKIITGNTKCQFAIRTTTQAEYITFDYRIDLDGGSGMDRIRTFMYDILLMISEITSLNHLGFLIHDNIFPSTGRDDMVKSLNFVNDQYKKGKNFQYIVTLNKDEFEAQIENFSFSHTDVTRAVFTRESPFLGVQYREM
jgi:uncharacterized protein YydD (DUF2326 family)